MASYYFMQKMIEWIGRELHISHSNGHATASRKKNPLRATALWDWYKEFIEIAKGVKGGGKLRGNLTFYTEKACRLAMTLSLRSCRL